MDRLTPEEIIARRRRGADGLTPGEIEEERRVNEAMSRYHARDYEREIRLRLSKAIAWGVVLLAIVTVAIVWILTDGIKWFLKLF